MTNDFSAGEEDSILAAFVSLSSELDSAQLEQLESLIKAYRSTISLDDKT